MKSIKIGQRESRRPKSDKVKIKSTENASVLRINNVSPPFFIIADIQTD